MAGQRNDHGKRSYSESDSAVSKRRNPDDDIDQHGIGPVDTVYRYLCPVRKIGSIIGIGGEIAKQLRTESKANIRISETMPGCEERIVTICSSSEETNLFDDSGEFVSPAQDALFRVHDRIIADELPVDEEFEEPQVTVRMLVPSDQIGCVIGKGGQVIQSIRSETHAQIRVLKDDHLPLCSLDFDELLQISGEPSVVRKALYQLASRLHENPSRSQQHLLSSSSRLSQSGSAYMGPNTGIQLAGPYGRYRDEAFAKEFSLRIVCPTGNIGSVIGKGGAFINQIRQESGAYIKVDSSAAVEDDCIIYISAKEVFEDPSPTIAAALRLQPRCSEKSERESGDLITTRLLVPSSQVGCLIGKGGAIISEMRSVTRANIRVLAKENLPKVASEDEEMVQITGGLNVAANALLQVTSRLRANVFEREGTFAIFSPTIRYVSMGVDTQGGSKPRSRDNELRGPGYSSYPGGYGSVELLPDDSDGSYTDLMSGGKRGYGTYGEYSSARSGNVRLTVQNPVSRGRNHGD